MGRTPPGQEKKLAAPIATPAAQHNLGQELDICKKLTRYLVAGTPDELTKAAFRANDASSKHRLATLMIKGHNPSIRMQPTVTQDEAKTITEAIVGTRRGMTSSKLKQVREKLDDPSRLGIWLTRVALNKKAPLSWRTRPGRIYTYEHEMGYSNKTEAGRKRHPEEQ